VATVSSALSKLKVVDAHTTLADKSLVAMAALAQMVARVGAVVLVATMAEPVTTELQLSELRPTTQLRRQLEQRQFHTLVSALIQQPILVITSMLTRVVVVVVVPALTLQQVTLLAIMEIPLGRLLRVVTGGIFLEWEHLVVAEEMESSPGIQAFATLITEEEEGLVVQLLMPQQMTAIPTWDGHTTQNIGTTHGMERALRFHPRTHCGTREVGNPLEVLAD
jgi:hypothetical protein